MMCFALGMIAGLCARSLREEFPTRSDQLKTTHDEAQGARLLAKSAADERTQKAKWDIGFRDTLEKTLKRLEERGLSTWSRYVSTSCAIHHPRF